jgi:hypothetical protein
MTHFIPRLLRRFGGKVQWFILRLIDVNKRRFLAKRLSLAYLAEFLLVSKLSGTRSLPREVEVAGVVGE